MNSAKRTRFFGLVYSAARLFEGTLRHHSLDNAVKDLDIFGEPNLHAQQWSEHKGKQANKQAGRQAGTQASKHAANKSTKLVAYQA